MNTNILGDFQFSISVPLHVQPNFLILLWSLVRNFRSEIRYWKQKSILEAKFRDDPLLKKGYF